MRYSRLARAAVDSTSHATASSSTALPRKARIAIIGAGPSGFYAASRILSRTPHTDVTIDLFDRLPVPHGLVRYGVAPDHPDVKNVEHKFAAVARDPRLRFAGNVNVVHAVDGGEAYPDAVHVPLGVLARFYTHILFSYGAATARCLGVPGSGVGELSGVYSALEFVNWYNGHPAAHDPRLRAEWFRVDLADKQHMTVIGAGNVALDVARIVLRSSTPFLESSARVTSNKAPGLAALEETDVPEPVLAELARCKVRDVDIFARRGPAQLAFTNKEVREMLALDGIALRPPQQQMLDAAAAQLDALASGGSSDAGRAGEIAAEVRVKKRLLGLLGKGSKAGAGGGVKTWGLNFFRSPARVLAREGAEGVGGVEWNVTALQSGQPTLRSLDAADPRTAAWGPADAAPASATGHTVRTQTDMVVSSVGYQSEPLSPPAPHPPHRILDDGRLVHLPWDSTRHIVPNVGGRIIDPSTLKPIRGAYVSGWLARGPNGVIATTMMDAYSVADVVLADLHADVGEREVDVGGDLLETLRREETKKVVGFEGWRAIDDEEKRRGQKLGKIREKILTVDEMLRIAS
ncbi:related to NADPH:adrenodoxin oxidoreductase precursor, mitochondrial [Sporisorium reilianum SRZ2]|uniref:NADPH:adrenodoxin oxidoreductase, mitochondrial n=1 Tax=Sporisorium reilianum (strain SRZ2) TaxID=999809 RepID=E6ZT87_SPORE|nr:related to NADPH:adrenodoxin oxidoreductase precursor, mitochondrial [Sporisorium reilianum SRZ2]